MILQKLVPFQNVGASQTCILPNLPLGMTYMGIILKRGGTTFTNTHLTNIRMSLDGKRFFDVTGPHLLVHNLYSCYHQLDYLLSHTHTENTAASYTQNATTAAPTTYSSQYDLIPFADFNARTIGGQMIGGIDTSVGYQSFSIEIDIGSATAPTLEAWAILEMPKAAADPNKATIHSMLKRTEYFGSSGEFNAQVPLGSKIGALINRVYFHNTYMTKLQVLKDQLYLSQEGESDLLSFMQSISNRNPQTGLHVFDPATDNNKSSTISTLRRDGASANFEFKATVSAADTVTIYSSVYATLDRI